MDKINQQLAAIYQAIPFWKVVGVLCALEVVSFAGFEFAWINTTVFTVILLVVGVASLKQLHWGVLAIFMELVLGSKGYLFSLQIGAHSLSIRLGLFVVVCAATVVWMIRERKIRFFEWSLWKPFVALFFAFVLAVIVAVLRQNGTANIFFDANGYLYFALIFPLTQSVRSRQQVNQLFAAIIAAGIVMMAETIVVLFVFSHLETFTYTLPEVYRWIRDTGVGEITRYPNGFVRVFFQSHIFAVYFFALSAMVLATYGVGKKQYAQRYWWAIVGVFSLSVLTVFLSYSRSFWLAIAVAVPCALAWLLFKQKVAYRQLAAVALFAAAVCIIDYCLVIGVVNFPLPGHQGVSSTAVLNDRTGDLNNEPAAASRWQLVQPLAQAAIQHPVLGSGFGKTITYTSADPRVVADHPDGRYTTYAFEWGYLDLWLKLGAVGVAAYAWVVFRIIGAGYAAWKSHLTERAMLAGAFLSLLCLFGVHMFTPYLNHPLGIGWLLVVAVFFTKAYDHTS